MNNNQKYIMTIFEEGSFSKAAERLFISQPALSLIVKKTEAQLGLNLFDRTTKPITLTPAGQCYIEYLHKIVEADEVLLDQLNSLRENTRGHLAVGGATYFCSYVLPNIIKEFKSQYPGYTITLTEGNPQYLSQLLQSSELNVTVDVETLDPRIFNCLRWRKEHILLAVPSIAPVNEQLSAYRLTFSEVKHDTYLNSDTPSVDLKEFSEEPFLFLKKGNDIYSRGLSMCKNGGFNPNILLYLDQMNTAYNIAKHGEGCTFIRADIAKYSEPTKKVFFYKINDALSVRDIFIYYKKSAPMSEACRNFIKHLQKYGVNDLH